MKIKSIESYDQAEILQGLLAEMWNQDREASTKGKSIWETEMKQIQNILKEWYTWPVPSDSPTMTDSEFINYTNDFHEQITNSI